MSFNALGNFVKNVFLFWLKVTWFFKAVQFQLHKSKCDALCKFISFKNDCVIYPQLQTETQH